MNRFVTLPEEEGIDMKQMYKYTFSNGDVMTSYLPKDEVLKRLRRLDILISMTEGHYAGRGLAIYKKAVAASNKLDNFTGIIRLNFSEKDWLGYKLEDESLSDERRKCIEWYIKY